MAGGVRQGDQFDSKTSQTKAIVHFSDLSLRMRICWIVTRALAVSSRSVIKTMLVLNPQCLTGACGWKLGL